MLAQFLRKKRPAILSMNPQETPENTGETQRRRVFVRILDEDARPKNERTSAGCV